MIFPSLWEHQKRAINTALNKMLLCFDCGCGKTRTALELFKKQFDATTNKHNYYKCIIFSPLNVCRNWVTEIERYVDCEKYDYEIFLVAGQNRANKLKAIREFSKFSEKSKPKFLVCNIETIRGPEYLAALKESRCNFIIADESHNFKNPTSLQTKGLIEIVEYMRATHVYLLTGTPCPGGEVDLWSTFRLLGVTRDSFFIWRKKYFEDYNARRAGTSGYYPDYRVKESSKKVFAEQLARCSITARKDEVLDLPDYVRTTIYCKLSDTQKRHYKTMREFLFAADENGNEATAQNILTRTLRLQQIVGGWLEDNVIADNERLEALNDAIDMIELNEPGAQFVIWTIFKPTYQQISDLLAKRGIFNSAFLTGGECPQTRFHNIKDFQSGLNRVLVAHPKAGGVGVNLTAASWSIHYLKNFSLTDDLQSEARNYRGGSEIHKRITRIDIVAQDTIDEDINEALSQKKSLQEFIMGIRK